MTLVNKEQLLMTLMKMAMSTPRVLKSAFEEHKNNSDFEEHKKDCDVCAAIDKIGPDLAAKIITEVFAIVAVSVSDMDDAGDGDEIAFRMTSDNADGGGMMAVLVAMFAHRAGGTLCLSKEEVLNAARAMGHKGALLVEQNHVELRVYIATPEQAIRAARSDKERQEVIDELQNPTLN